MFADIVNQVAQLERSDEAKPYYPRPSMAGPEGCIRKMVYHALGAEAKPLPGRAVLTFDDSSTHEELTFKWFSKTIYTLHSQQKAVEIPAPGLLLDGFFCRVCGRKVAPETLHGHIDWMAEDPIGEQTLVEHKALSTFQVRRYSAGALPLNNLTQGCIYVRGAQADFPGLERLLLVIKDKNSARYVEFNCRYHSATDILYIDTRIESNGDAPPIIVNVKAAIPGIIEMALLRFMDVDGFAARGELPARPYDYGTDFPCGWCLWAGPCWDRYEDELTAASKSVKLGAEVALIALEYEEARAAETQAKEAKDAKRTELIRALSAANAQAGIAGDFRVSRSITTKKSYAVAASTFEVVRVKRTKGEKEGSDAEVLRDQE